MSLTRTEQVVDIAKERYAAPSIPPPLMDTHLHERISSTALLQDQGWSPLGLKVNPAQPDPLRDAFSNLLAASKQFFDLPQDFKQQYARSSSEFGWSRVEGEKELITLRSVPATPEVLREPAAELWSVCGAILNTILGHIAQSLGLPSEALTVYSEPTTKLGEQITATMLRLFRYEGDFDEDQIVSEPHNDLGLLSLVYGNVPGLETWDRWNQAFVPLEKDYRDPCASVLCGTQLARITNHRYIPGGHRVVSYAHKEKASSGPHYRYSIVFILRAHWPVPLDTDKLTTPYTGTFRSPLRNMTAGDLFKQISDAHFNVNISKSIRDEQRRRLAESAPKAG